MPDPDKYNAPIQYFNRYTGEMETEDIYGEGFLRWAYGNPLGRLTVSLAIKRLWFSRWYGWRMDKPKSRAKVQPFIEQFGVDVNELADSPQSYKTFNEFFYRKLKPEARPIDEAEDAAVFPADGRHLAIPNVSSADSFYIKGQSFDLSTFIGDANLAQQFEGGSILISRLCPVDYHRFHFPAGGSVGSPQLLPGTLRSVSPLALRRQLSILWENRRERTIVESERFGKVLVMEVGATCVGGIHQTFAEGTVRKGDDKGYFSFGGSNVTTVFQPGAIQFDADLTRHSANGIEVYAKMGERCGVSATPP
ncbi:MAG: phosphatidylserine decarboxylase, partial [Planctomycetaceae bacterium]